ncbi:MAG: methyltransferase domain-containing protein [Thermodesulfobacteriota bacterium]
MDIIAIQKAYKRYARLYDFYFGQLFQPGRKAVIQRLDCRPGEKILEVGVGTGLSLPLYPGHVRLTGIDISPEMLARARTRVSRDGLAHVEELAVMDAESMRFADNSFDKVVAMYVASVVPHPERLVEEMRRVCKAGGELFIVNHFLSDNPLLGGMERLVSPLSRLIGFRPDLSVNDFIAGTRLSVVDALPVNLFGYWTLLRASNDKGTTPSPERNPSPPLPADRMRMAEVAAAPAPEATIAFGGHGS